MVDQNQIPQEVQVTDDLDLVLISSPPSFFSQLARLAVIEKGVKWKIHSFNHGHTFTHLTPWYMQNINPGGVVPVMLVKDPDGPRTKAGNPA